MNIALSGKLASGKSVLANQLEREKNYKVLSIGSSIKKVLNLLIEDQKEMELFLYENLENNEKLENIIKEVKKEFELNYNGIKFIKLDDGTYVKDDNYRKLSQYIATIFREKFGEDFWVKLISEISINESKKGNKIVIDDLRFKVEKEVFELYGFKTIRINVSQETQIKRINSRGDGQINLDQLNHKSEIDLDEEIFNLEINSNDLDMEEVKEIVFNFIN